MPPRTLGHWAGTGVACVVAFLLGVLIGAVDWSTLPPRHSSLLEEEPVNV
jgi:hypothetical protein